MDADLQRAHADMDEGHWWFRGRRRIIGAVLRSHVAVGAGTVIDLGCGAGGLLEIVGRHGGHVVAIEGEPGLAQLARSRHPDVEVRIGWLPDAVAELPSASLITAFDVIEHLDDDVAALRSMVARLDPHGAVCVTVPALPLLWSEHDTANGHRRRYTARTLRSAMEEAGLVVTHLSYFNTVLFPLVLVARLVGCLRGSTGATDFDRSAGPLDHVFAWVFGAERHLVRRWRLPFGVSLIAIARPERTVR